ncbi:MAG: hypothetical protein AVDCRST_MAG96-475 [uncultured Segetibacter sp.]|uniref:Uncharacterized protein n=1 Tax=uncultured Segetibacter sp. TaxID=481133 RepID=A0A6J4RF52_9BACT|nr:MAG: hypothetical protein AVDCRST_MAG96-475 [uncultured Segetibacter sp.]
MNKSLTGSEGLCPSEPNVFLLNRLPQFMPGNYSGKKFYIVRENIPKNFT